MTKKRPVRRQSRLRFLRWHRTVGVSVGFFLIVIAVSGLLLNHGNQLALDKTPLPRSLLFFYGVDIQTPEQGFSAHNNWLVASGNQLFFNENPVGSCKTRFVGVFELPMGVLAVCSSDIYLLTKGGELIEHSMAVPEPLQQLLPATADLYIQGEANTYQFDPDDFSWQVIQAQQLNLLTGSTDAQQPNKIAPSLEPIPKALADNIAGQAVIKEITWERFILDLHAGRLFGQLGVWFVDLLGVALVGLALSGIWLYLKRTR